MLRKKSWATLSCLVLLLELIMFFAGCENFPEYRFNGRIGDEQIRTDEFIGWYQLGMQLEVVKPDGSKIIYRGKGENGKFTLKDVIIITPAGDITVYKAKSSNPLVREIVRKAQIQFDFYLKKIVETKTAPLLNQERAAPCSSFYFANL